MKKALFAMVALLLTATGQIVAQDIITLKDGTDIKAKILEITPTELKYKKYNNLEGPTITILKSQVLIVRYENGENEVFNDSQKNTNNNDIHNSSYIHDYMKYSEYKNLYDKNKYIRQIGDPYSPSGCGWASFFIPGLGQAIADEWGRAAWIFIVNVGLGAVSVRAAYNYAYYGDNTSTLLLVASSFGRLVFDIWSIVDAVNVAKIKNMHSQELRARQTSSLNISMTPYLGFASCKDNSKQPVTGLSFNLSF
ncbi:MAG: hypothetical protein IJ785_01150 [Bacteroidales bacterium]|nr:hypothetical protein [Bacteroidales bacterium]